MGAVKTLQNCDKRAIHDRLAARPPVPADRPDLRPAAVLVPLFPDGRILLTRRPQTLRKHPGQIAFPGGAYETSDPDLRHTALREAHEEVGLESEHVELLGELDHVWTPTGYVLVPYVGWVEGAFVERTDPGEVEEILFAQVEELMRPGVYREEDWEREGVTHRVVFFDLPGATVWGATGRVLVNFLQVACGWTGAAERPWETR